MKREYAHKRKTKVNGHDCYDINGVWPSGRVESGVKFVGWLVVAPREPLGEPHRVQVWVPPYDNPQEGGQNGAEHAINFPYHIWFPVKGGGRLSVVALDDQEYDVWWEIFAGKA